MKYVLVNNGKYIGLSGEVMSKNVNTVEALNIENAITFPKKVFAKKFVEDLSLKCEIKEVDNE